jgi:hypothetical protein
MPTIKRQKRADSPCSVKTTSCTGESDELETLAVSEKTPEPDDVYDTCAKNITRFSFARYCVDASKSAKENGILYLESPHGGATKELLKYFDASQLFPCNKSDEAVAALKKRFPGVNVLKGNIYKLYKTRTWLGVWFDTEETWQHIHQPGQPWKLDHVPSFDRAPVIAVTLTIGSGPNPVKGGAERLAIELAQLFQDNGGKMDVLPFAYDGKSNRMNMVFGVAKFKHKPTWEVKNYIYARLRVPVKDLGKFDGMAEYMVIDGHYIATVVVNDGKMFAVYMSRHGNFFEEPDPLDELSVEQVNKWMESDPHDEE